MRRKAIALLIAILLLWPATRADVELVFRTGDTIKGQDVRRDGNDYVLTTYDGGSVRIPLSDVSEVRLVGKPDETAEEPTAEEPTAREEEDSWPPTGLTVGEPEVLVGEEVTPPETSRQLGVLGKPAQFQRSAYDPTWHPKSALGPDALAGSRSTFTQSSYDPSWHPESAYKGNVLDNSRSKWQEAPYDPTWVPRNGFAEERRQESSPWS